MDAREQRYRARLEKFHADRDARAENSLKKFSDKLTDQQNAALARFEALTGAPVFGIAEFERGEIDAAKLWGQNKAWLEGVLAEVQNIQF